MATLGIDIEFDVEDEEDEEDEVEEFDDLEEVEELDDLDDVEDLDDLDGVEEVGAGVEELSTDGVEEVTDDDDIVFDDLDEEAPASLPDEAPRAAMSFGASPAPRPLAAPSPPAPIVKEKPSETSRRRSQTSSGLDLPPSMRPQASGLDLAEDIEEDAEFGELHFDEEHPTSPVNISEGPPAPDLGEVRMDAPSAIPLARETAAEYAMSRGPQRVEYDHDAIEEELGVDLSLNIGRQQSAPAPDFEPQIPGRSHLADESVHVGKPHPSFGQSVAHEPPPSSVQPPRGAYEDPFGSAVSPVPGRASVRPSRPPGGGDRTTSADVEPYGLAPSAQMPPAAPISLPRTPPPIEPPSRPTTAPPPGAMREPEERPSRLPEVRPTGYPSGHPSAPPPGPAISNAPEPDEVDDMFAAISRPPPKPSTRAPEAKAATSNVAEAPAPPGPAAGFVEQTDDGGILVDGIDLMEIPGLQDLPDDAALSLAQKAQLVTLQTGEEVSSFGVALVTHGAVQLMPTVADATCAHARKGEILFTKGTLESEVEVRVVGYEPGSRVAVFPKDALSAATSECPWVGDELAEVADKYLAFAGAVLGPLGDSLDETFRFMVFDKCTVKSKAPGAIIAQAGSPMDGMYIVGGGSLELLNEDGSVFEELHVGDFVFPETVLSAGPASKTARAGKDGALVLFANRMGAHELLATCPPFIELLAG